MAPRSAANDVFAVCVTTGAKGHVYPLLGVTHLSCGANGVCQQWRIDVAYLFNVAYGGWRHRAQWRISVITICLCENMWRHNMCGNGGVNGIAM